jgi:hypothetical protein
MRLRFASLSFWIVLSTLTSLAQPQTQLAAPSDVLIPQHWRVMEGPSGPGPISMTLVGRTPRAP